MVLSRGVVQSSWASPTRIGKLFRNLPSAITGVNGHKSLLGRVCCFNWDAMRKKFIKSHIERQILKGPQRLRWKFLTTAQTDLIFVHVYIYTHKVNLKSTIWHYFIKIIFAFLEIKRNFFLYFFVLLCFLVFFFFSCSLLLSDSVF